jgi:serine/threonine protein kinase
MFTENTSSNVFADSLSIRCRTDSVWKDTLSNANAECKESVHTICSEDTSGGADVEFEQPHIAKFINNSANLVEPESQGPDIHSASEDKTGGTAAEPNPLTVARANPAYLRTRINDISKTYPIGLNQEGHYVPDRELIEMFNEETTREALGEGVDITLIEFVLKKAPKTFATLQLVFSKPKHRKMAMKAFQKSGFTDELLDSKNLILCKSSPCPQPKEPCSHFFPYSAPWDDVILSQFKTLRWTFLVPTFNHERFRYEFDPQRLLPFKVRADSKKLSSGNFSDVICVDMLADKQTILLPPLPETIAVAHKTLRPLDVPKYDIHMEWVREAEAHRQLNGISAHLVKGIAAYHRVANNSANNTYHIVLEWADGGNLFDFCNKSSEPQLDEDTARSRERVRMLLEQLCGLSHAVECMHSMHNETATSSRQNTGDLLEDQHANIDVIPTKGSLAPVLNIIEAPIEDNPGRARHSDSANFSLGSLNEGPSLLHPASRRHLRRASDAKNWRHGDIKPENILRFTGGDRSAWLGTLKLADLGRAQQHDLKTAQRSTIEKERWRTRWYEPPDLSVDLHRQAHGKISRLFDIWSMGCVILESVIWLLYGSSEITRFQKIETLTAATPYWRKIRYGSYQVTERASLWMDHILKYDTKQASAIGDVVKLVRDRLLKVDLPPDSDVYTPGKRTNAKNMREELARILDKASREPEYLFDGVDKFGSSPPPADISTPIQQFSTSPNHLLVPSGERSADMPIPVGHRTRIEEERVYTDSMTDVWQYPDDHRFAERMINQDQTPNEDDLCDHCKNIDIKSPELVFNRSSLEADYEQCALCDLIKKAIDRVELPAGNQIRLERDSDCFFAYGSDGSKLKILRVCCPDQGEFRLGVVFDIANLNVETSESLTGVPVGAPSLYDPPGVPKAADAFMRLPREWLKECDDKHRKTCAVRSEKIQLPKRLVDLKSKKPKIVDSASINLAPEAVRYIAFSHKWGKMPEAALSTKTNLQARRTAIPPRGIPPSFADVIAITKALGCDYLWIDCLCINQGEDGDFAEQAVSMQAVFSNAYCVIAAASADGAVDGFLKRDTESNPLDAVKVGSVYFSAVTNDFSRDVLKSPLNSRGWVLQERALARRTIFFTANQMYWECGDGIRCETLRKLKQ